MPRSHFRSVRSELWGETWALTLLKTTDRVKNYIMQLARLLDVYQDSIQVESRSVVSDSVTPWTIQSMEFSRPGYWSW